jgi:hypothetical protein
MQQILFDFWNFAHLRDFFDQNEVFQGLENKLILVDIKHRKGF